MTAHPPALALLRKIPLLAGLEEHALAHAAAQVELRRVEKGRHVIEKGSAGNHLLFLFSGRLQAVDLTEDGREIGLNFLSAGDYFGELSIIDGLPRSATVMACEPSTIGLLPRLEAQRLIYTNPQVVERLLIRLARSIRMAANYRAILGMPNAHQRVYALLQQMTLVAPGGLVVIEKMPTQQEIAIMVNTSRETVSRAVHVLIDKGVVQKDLRRLIVRQPLALREAAASGDSDGSA